MKYPRGLPRLLGVINQSISPLHCDIWVARLTTRIIIRFVSSYFMPRRVWVFRVKGTLSRVALEVCLGLGFMVDGRLLHIDWEP